MLSNASNSFIYWEKQGSDKLCGVHCINSLLQGPFFNEIILSEIALELDSAEKDLMAAQGVNSKDFINYIAQDSNNVADDGNYSIQVLSKALLERFEMTIESVDAKINKHEDLSQENGFICNSSSHWFAIRKINNVWYNLNSTSREGPEIVSDFYLSAFLCAVKENGYTIFVVKGNFPQTNKASFSELNQHQRWFTMAQIEEIHKKNLANKNFKLNIGGTDERDLEEAIKNSLKDKNSNFNNDNDQDDKNNSNNINQDKPQPTFFTGAHVNFEPSSGMSKNKIKGYEKYNFEYENDPELAFAFKLSLSSKFDENILDDNNLITVNFNYPNGKKKQRKFANNSTVEDLYDFVKYDMEENYDFYLFSTYPKRTYDDLSLNFKTVEISDMQSIFISKLQ